MWNRYIIMITKMEEKTDKIDNHTSGVEAKHWFFEPERLFVLGFWLILLPCYYLFCVLLRLNYGKELYFFEVINAFWKGILNNFYFRFIIPEFLVIGPVLAFIVTLISMIKIKSHRFESERNTSTIFGLNLIVCVISLGLIIIIVLFISKNL